MRHPRQRNWLRELVVADLHRNGPVVDRAGRAMQLLADRVGHHSSMSVGNVVRELVADGAALRVVARDGEAPRDGDGNPSPNPRRTYRIELTDRFLATRPAVEEECAPATSKHPAPGDAQPVVEQDDGDDVASLPRPPDETTTLAPATAGTQPKVRLTGTRRRILVALNDTPVEDRAGRAVHCLADRVGARSIDALSILLVRMERHGLVERTVRGKRTYRLAITDRGRSVADLPPPPPGWRPRATPAPRRQSVLLKEMPDGPARAWDLMIPTPVPAPAGRTAAEAGPGPASLELQGPVAGAGQSAGGSVKRLTKPRVEILRALLAGGPIDDPAGHATRILMSRIGRTHLPGTHMVVTGMAEAGLVRRTLRNGRVVRLEAVPVALSPRDLRLVWSSTAFPIEATPASPAAGAASSTAEVETLRVELAAARAELARVRLQLEMFRAWAKRVPDLQPSDDDAPPPRPAALRPSAQATPATDPAALPAIAPESHPLCQYIHPATDPNEDRRGQPPLVTQ